MGAQDRRGAAACVGVRLQGAGRLIGYSELDLQLAVFFAPLPEFLRQAERVGAIVLNRSCLVLPRNGNIVEFLRNMGRWRHRRGRAPAANAVSCARACQTTIEPREWSSRWRRPEWSVRYSRTGRGRSWLLPPPD